MVGRLFLNLEMRWGRLLLDLSTCVVLRHKTTMLRALLSFLLTSKKSFHYRKQPLQDERPLSEQDHSYFTKYVWVDREMVKWLAKAIPTIVPEGIQILESFLFKLGCALSFAQWNKSWTKKGRTQRCLSKISEVSFWACCWFAGNCS